MILPGLILILSFVAIVMMHEDTLVIQAKRAAAAKVVPEYVQAAGATRKFKTKVLEGGEVRHRVPEESQE